MKIKVNLKARAYKIIVGANIMRNLGRYIRELSLGDNAYVITNKSLKNKYGRVLNQALKKSGIRFKFKLVPDSEQSKSLNVASRIIEDLARLEKKRRTFIIAFGGGVIGDLSGFVASIYKRGIPYVQIPTTLLAQVDSGIGGKTAVDLPEGKNLIGTFYQPRLVFSDVEILSSLNLRQIRSGLAEVIKYGIIKDPNLFIYLEARYKDILALKRAPLEFIVRRCSFIKAKITQQDEREEKGIRTILNFGHTIGHALEAAGNYKKYNHGEAVALGMLVAADLSKRIGLLDSRVLERIENLIEAVGLPVRIKGVAQARIIKAYYQDKKFIGSRNRFVLLEDIGRTKIVQNIPLKLIKESIKARS